MKTLGQFCVEINSAVVRPVHTNVIGKAFLAKTKEFTPFSESEAKAFGQGWIHAVTLDTLHLKLYSLIGGLPIDSFSPIPKVKI